MSGTKWTFEEWVGLIVRLFFGALFGAAIAFASSRIWGAPGGAGPNWLHATAIIVVCAVLAARFGDDFWTGALKPFRWWWR